MPPRPILPTDLTAGQSGVVSWFEELNSWHNLDAVWRVPAGASRSAVQDMISDAEAEYAGAEGGAGIILLSPGSYDWTGTLEVTKTAVSIGGPNPASCVVNHSGPGPAIRWANNPTTVQQQGQMSGFTLLSDGSANGVGVHCFDTGTCPALRDMVIHGFPAAGIWLENDAIWNERFTADRLFLDDNGTGLLMSAESGSIMNSFGYARVNSMFLGINTGQVGIRSAGSAFVYNGFWRLQANGGGGTSKLIQVDAESKWPGIVVDVTGEALGIGVQVDPGGLFNPSGFWNPAAPDVGNIDFGFCFNSTGQLRSNAAEPPRVDFGPNAGSVTVAPAAFSTGNSLRGHINFGTGSPVAAGGLMVVTWQRPFPNSTWVPEIVLQARNRETAALGLYVDLVTPTSFAVGCDVAPAANQPNTTYSFTYHVLG